MLKKPVSFGIILMILVAGASSLYFGNWSRKNSSAVISGYTEIAIHPQASTETTETAKSLHTLVPFNGKLYPGYGDYGANTGPTVINPYNPSTGTFTGSVLSSATEEIDTYKILNSKIYAPDIDPITGESSGGYAVGEPFSHKSPVTAVHVFDIVNNGTDLFMAGAVGNNATVWRSTDGGTTWSVSLSLPPVSGQSFSRFYWIGTVNGKVYVCNDISGQPLKAFNGTTWSDGPVLPGIAYRSAQQFGSKLIIRGWGPVWAFDGTTITQIAGFGSTYRDSFVDGGYWYVFKADNSVARTTNLSTWETVFTGGPPVESAALLNNYLYFGGPGGKLYRSTSQIGAAPPPADITSPTVSLTTPANGAAVSGTVNMTATASDNTSVSRVDFYVDNNLAGSDTTSPYSYSWNTATASNASHSLQAKAVDPSNNLGSSASITVTVNNAGSSSSSGGGSSSSTTSSSSGSTTTVTVGSAGSGSSPSLSGTVKLATTNPPKPGVSIVKVEYYVDNRLIQTVTTPPFTLDLDTKNLSDGQHTVTVKKYLSDGSTTEDKQPITVNNPVAITKTAPKPRHIPVLLYLGAGLAGLVGLGAIAMAVPKSRKLLTSWLPQLSRHQLVGAGKTSDPVKPVIVHPENHPPDPEV